MCSLVKIAFDVDKQPTIKLATTLSVLPTNYGKSDANRSVLIEKARSRLALLFKVKRTVRRCRPIALTDVRFRG
jgi:hypothetical protein